jgi:asparagine synthase (glutamine-hydrolysing)
MSGIVGMYRRDGAPVERSLLQSLTHFLSSRGPDRRETWTNGPVGLGHTLLRTARESLGERQPASIEGNLWITADARLDCRAELEAKLDSEGRKYQRPAPDPELILHAYAAWGEACVQHLFGDFAFAIWDARRRTLFCARDHFGIRPFYYADLGDHFIFSNTLDCVRLHPDVSDDLNEAAIADFLLFGLNCDLRTTTFKDIQRLPPAHTLTVSPEGTRVARYWSAPIGGRIRYRHADEYVERFQMLLQAAVADRLRTSPVGILLSGGLDSSSIAATARELTANSAGAADLRAYTVTHELLLADQDGENARTVAEFLKIPIRCLSADDLQLFERWDDPELAWPEPVDDPFMAGLYDQYRMISQDCRVAMSGEGIDNLMHFEMLPYARHLVGRREWKHLFADVPNYLRRRPSIWPGVRRLARGVFRKDLGAAVFPEWIARDFAQRLNLEDRWKELNEVRTSPAHPVVPTAHASLSLPHWSRMFELENAGVTRRPVEVRYPFLDLRIVDYMLAIPPFPWAFEKSLLREAMVGHLPEAVRARPKTPLAGDPLVENLKRPDAGWVDRTRWNKDIERYVNTSALPHLSGEQNAERVNFAIRPLCLNFWLQSARGVRYNLSAEVRNA